MYREEETDGYKPFWTLKKIVGAAVAAVLILVIVPIFIAQASLNRVQSNEWGCLYGGGLFESRSLKEVIPPGKSGGITIADNLVTVPADDRIYAIDSDPTTADFGGQPIVVPAKGSNATADGIVPVVVPVQARFSINENACLLWQQHLKSKSGPIDWNGTNIVNGVYEPGRWPKFLNLQMNQVLIAAARNALAGASYVELYTDFSRYPEYQKKISESLTTALEKSLGGQFFCGPSYQFDGKADGVVENCPPIEIVIKEIKPQDPVFLNNLQTIVANQEQQTVIKSDKEKAIAQTNADKETSLAKTEAEKEKALAKTKAEQETSLAQTEADRQVKLAKALADAEVAKAFAEVARIETDNQIVKVEAETAFCRQLAGIGVNCADYYKYQNYNPQVVLADNGSTPLIPVNIK